MIVDGKKDRIGDIRSAWEASHQDSARPLSASGSYVASRDPVIRIVRAHQDARCARTCSVDLVRFDLPEEASILEALAAVQSLTSSTDGVIVQLPLPHHLDAEAIRSGAISERARCRSDQSRASHYEDETRACASRRAPLPRFSRSTKCRRKGRRAIVVGAGRLVGAPCAKLLEHLGADVFVITKEKGSLDELKDADIIILGAGDPGFVKPDMIRQDVVPLSMRALQRLAAKSKATPIPHAPKSVRSSRRYPAASDRSLSR